MPEIVIVADEAGVPGSTLTVATDVPEPGDGGVTLAGENETCTPLGTELALNVTAELNVPTDVTVTVSLLEVPDATVRLNGLRLKEKSAPEVTVKVKVVL